MTLSLRTCALCDWAAADAAALARHADDRAVWRNLRDRFPHPYSIADAERWLGRVCAETPRRGMAILVGGEVAGGVGLELGEDVHRYTAEIGFWLGRPFWGRGVMTEAVIAFSELAFDRFELSRLYATVFEWNPASMRVLEKAGYAREGTLRRSAFKDGQTIDTVMFARVR